MFDHELVFILLSSFLLIFLQSTRSIIARVALFESSLNKEVVR